MMELEFQIFGIHNYRKKYIISNNYWVIGGEKCAEISFFLALCLKKKGYLVKYCELV